MDRLMDVWIDEDGGAFRKGIKKNRCYSQKKKKKGLCSRLTVFPWQINEFPFLQPTFCVYFVPDQYARGGLWKPDDAETQLIH